MDLGIWTYVKLLLASAVVSSLINLGYSISKDRRERRTERTLVALEAALALEAFTRVCAHGVSDCAAAENEAGRQSSYAPFKGLKLPMFHYPDTVVWKWLEPEVVTRLRDFPTACEASRRHLFVDGDWNDDPFSHVGEISLACACLGRDAWELAQFVRRKHGLPDAATHEHDRDIQEVIKTRLGQQAEWLARREREIADFNVPTASPD